VRLDWEIAKRGWGRYAAYPAAAWAGAFTNSIFGFMQAYVLVALYAHRTYVGGYDVGDTVTYVWLAQALIMTVYVFGWEELALRIRDGSIATDLSRPLNPQRYWLAFDLGRAPFHFIFRGIPPFLIGAFAFNLHYPSPALAAAFALSVLLAVVVSLGFRFLYNVAAFWIVDHRGVLRLSVTACLFFSGMTLPLAFFPSWLESFARVLPFASIIQVPIDIYLGKHSGANLAAVLAVQAAWAVALLTIGRIALARGTRKLVVQGG
jgi:ABC-2 type transport system permease protein